MTELRWVRLPPRLVPFDGPVGEHGEIYVHAADVLAALFDDVDDLIAALGRILSRD